MPLLNSTFVTRSQIVTCASDVCYRVGVESETYALQRFEGAVDIARMYGRLVYLSCGKTCKAYREVTRESIGTTQSHWLAKVPWPFLIALVVVLLKARSSYKKRKKQ